MRSIAAHVAALWGHEKLARSFLGTSSPSACLLLQFGEWLPEVIEAFARRPFVAGSQLGLFATLRDQHQRLVTPLARHVGARDRATPPAPEPAVDLLRPDEAGSYDNGEPPLPLPCPPSCKLQEMALRDGQKFGDKCLGVGREFVPLKAVRPV
jgi:hypothetical protein